jgi:hypothetical protein
MERVSDTRRLAMFDRILSPLGLGVVGIVRKAPKKAKLPAKGKGDAADQTERQMAAAKSFMKRRRNALRELAKR